MDIKFSKGLLFTEPLEFCHLKMENEYIELKLRITIVT